MLPTYISKDKGHERFSAYQFDLDLFKGDHFKHFNFNEQEKKLHAYEYICYSILKEAVQIKTNLIWQETPLITFDNSRTQKAFNEMRHETNFDYIMSQATAYSYVFGDSLVKIAIDENVQTANEEDYKLCLYLASPMNWYPDYNEYAPMREAQSNTLIHKKEVEREGVAYLLETFTPGQITWTAFFEKTNQKNSKGETEATQIPVLRYFREELYGVVATGEVTEESLEVVYETGCNYSLLQRIKNQTSIDSYFGLSDFTQPVKSKINAINNYSNLADVIIVTNAFPKLILSENASNLLKRVYENIENARLTNADRVDGAVDEDLTLLPGTTFLSSQRYLTSYAYRELINQMRAFEDGSKGGETRYLQNDFSLEEIRQQHKIYFNALMAELDISEVFYNPELSTGAKSGVAYKRLMTTTLNAIEIKKRHLTPVIKNIVYTMLEIANVNNLSAAKPEMPKVEWRDGVVNDEAEDLANLVTKVQNQFIPLVEAISIVNDVDEAKAQEILDMIQGENKTQPNGQSEDTESDAEREDVASESEEPEDR